MPPPAPMHRKNIAFCPAPKPDPKTGLVRLHFVILDMGINAETEIWAANHERADKLAFAMNRRIGHRFSEGAEVCRAANLLAPTGTAH